MTSDEKDRRIAVRETILKTAIDCVCKDRNDIYGEPEDNFKEIARLWSAYKGVTFRPEDIAIMMALLKIARIKTAACFDADSYIDAAGYIACAAGIAEMDEC